MPDLRIRIIEADTAPGEAGRQQFIRELESRLRRLRAALNDEIGPPMSAVDTYTYHSVGADGPASFAAVITPSDSADLAYVTRALIVGTAGNLAVITDGGSDLTIPSCPAGILPLRVSRVKATGTTASNLTALW